MLNKKPIFIVAFAYGGSNILLNLLRSHPQVCSPRGETNEVFTGKVDEFPATRWAKRLRYLPCVLAEGKNIFSWRDWQPRRPFKAFTQRRVDRILFDEKLRARDRSQNLYKYENVPYADEEIKSSRLLCKSLDGLIYLTPEFLRMYPDATFLALVRNGFAVCEGHIRRGHRVEEIVQNYERACQLMIKHSKTISNYHLMRYEDLIAQPLEMLKKVYEWAGLDIQQVQKIRLQAKKVIEKDGSHQVILNKDWKDVIWYDLDEFGKHFRKDTNDNQIKRLTEDQKSVILKTCRSSLEHFGYLTPRAS